MTVAPAPLSSLLTHFVGQARWFGGKGRPFRVTGVHAIGELPPARPLDPRVVVHLVTLTYDDAAPGRPADTEDYQVPLAYYPEVQDRLAHAFVGVIADTDGTDEHHVDTTVDAATWYLYDAVHDRAAMRLYQRAFTRPPLGDLAFHRLPGHELDLGAHSTVFSGEQSNSSVAFGDDALMKVFRRITTGPNPDIEIQRVLTAARCPHVAELYGWLEAPAPAGSGTSQGDDVLHLAMLQQFLRTASDGWELALTSVRDLFAEGDLHADEVGGDFAGESARLGAALAATHAALAEHFPVEDLPATAVHDLADAMRGRLEQALPIVPALADYADDLRAAYDALADLAHGDDLAGGAGGLRVQRIHGDLHLGQTLRTSRGWKIVDFEGEPAKPLAERRRPDSPWRDVAGMLRSLDYAPRVVERTWIQDSQDAADQRAYRAAQWSERNRTAFVAAYAGRDLTAAEEVVLAAYVADKAVYETVYETRNRPTWVGIPLQALARIGAR